MFFVEKLNLFFIDEFVVYFDILMVMRVVRKVVEIICEVGIIVFIIIYWLEVLKVFDLDRVFFVGYGIVRV